MMIRKKYRYIFDDEKNSEEEVAAAVDSSHTLMTHCHPAALITYYLLPLSFARISLPPACICFASCCLRAWHGRQPLRDAPCQFFFSFYLSSLYLCIRYFVSFYYWSGLLPAFVCPVPRSATHSPPLPSDAFGHVVIFIPIGDPGNSIINASANYRDGGGAGNQANG